MSSTCEACGSQPVALITSRRHLGLIIYGRKTTSKAYLCKPHARGKLSSDLAKTAVVGWWGAFSFFINIFVVLGQFAGLSAAAKIGDPVQPVNRSVPAAEQAS